LTHVWIDSQFISGSAPSEIGGSMTPKIPINYSSLTRLFSSIGTG
jgi:hypothetical protein